LSTVGACPVSNIGDILKTHVLSSFTWDDGTQQ